MRLVFDVFPCQTGSRFRGIGRYTQSLLAAMAHARANHDLYVLANALYPQSADALRQQLNGILPAGHFAACTSTNPSVFGNDRRTYEQVATALIHRAYEELAPDAVLYANPFEGWREQGVVALPNGRLPSALRVGILYDLIPWLFQDQYLDQIPGYKTWYAERLEALQKFDLLLAISEATRQDAIDILKWPEDRVVNISGAPSPSFHPGAATLFPESHLARLGIARPFVLYTGNGDYRKNQDGLLQAYARLPWSLRRSHQLVLNQVGDNILFDQKMRTLGLTSDDVVVTGHVTDDELGYLYARCKVFVFPSLYEGFGLPILEAMACGAPVIAANNSSIPEVAGRSDILFDASSPKAIAKALEDVLVDDRLRKELSDYGICRAREFNWNKTAGAAWRAIESRLENRDRKNSVSSSVKTEKARIALMFAFDENDSSSAQTALTLLPTLAQHFDIDLFVQDGADSQIATLSLPFNISSYTELAECYADYATFVYLIANTPSHAGMLPLMEAFPGVVVMLDLDMTMPVHALAQSEGRKDTFANEIIHTHGIQGLVAHLKGSRLLGAPDVSRHVLESAQHLILPDGRQKAFLESAACGSWLPPMTALSTGNAFTDAAVFIQAIERAIDADQRHTIGHIADVFENTAPDDEIVDAIAAHAVSNKYLRKQPRLLIDVTQLSKTDARSGIQRVVRNIVKEVGTMSEIRRPLEIVRQADGKLWRATAVTGAIFDVAPQSIPSMEVQIHPGDILLMIDSSWEQYAEFSTIFERVRLFGGRIVTVVYDLIPLRRPETCHPGLVAVFGNWFKQAVSQSDMLLCISRSVAEDVKTYLDENRIPLPRPLEVTHWPLGADLGVNTEETPIRQQVIALAEDRQSPLFLMVGTVEPRKGHDFVLDAFDALWQSGEDFRLCIAGGVGWMVDDTVRRIRTHPYLNERLFFVEKFTDAEINRCYSAATALIAASVAEGFGLPIVEAALHHVPTLASDIPVFREVGGDGAIYFSLHEKDDLANKVRAISRMPLSSRRQHAARVKTHTWRESAEHLLDVVLDKRDCSPLPQMKAA